MLPLIQIINSHTYKIKIQQSSTFLRINNYIHLFIFYVLQTIKIKMYFYENSTKQYFLNNKQLGTVSTYIKNEYAVRPRIDATIGTKNKSFLN